MNPARHASLELLRTAAALAVVGVHAAAMVLVALPDGQGSAWWAANLWDSFCHWCVPVFVMISGAVLLSGPADQPAGEFYRRRALRLWQPALFWTLLYLALAAATALAALSMKPWPFAGRILVREHHTGSQRSATHVFDQWCLLGSADDESALASLLEDPPARRFDADIYRIINRWLAAPEHLAQVQAL